MPIDATSEPIAIAESIAGPSSDVGHGRCGSGADVRPNEQPATTTMSKATRIKLKLA
jgi:hypothetical protein